MYVCVPLCVCHMDGGASRGQKRAMEFPELELQAVVSSLIWVLRSKE